ncbi:MAG: UDP-N-acetylmuramoyl-L-alanyl-D-glutamate--2,6-diaminopimelate ligase [Parcubacteria group bacterium]
MRRRMFYLAIVFGLLFVSGLVWFVVTANSRKLSQPPPGPAGLFDTDQDGLSDAREQELSTNPGEPDSDFDGLTDREEVEVYTTQPLNADSDADGFVDGVEVRGGYNPKGTNLLLSLLNALRKLVPRPLLVVYHAILNWVSQALYGFPTRKLVTIGVTGTTGKTSVISYTSALLEAAGYKTGYISTATIKVGSRTRLNPLKMTMPGRWTLARILRKIVRSGARYALIETSSQGLEQYRHLGIAYDVALFTNLTPEHIEAHGSFEKYRQAKERLFAGLSRTHRKSNVKKIIVVNCDDPNAHHFLRYDADEKWGYSLESTTTQALPNMIRPTSYSCGPNGINFTLRDSKGNEIKVHSKLVGIFNLYNMLAAVAVAESQGVTLSVIQSSLQKLEAAPGRMEPINLGQPFTVIVDYAHVPESLELVYKTLRLQLAPGKKLIAVLGSAGGGRDVAKRPKLGTLAARLADFSVITNEDPYDEDPHTIIWQVVGGLKAAGKQEGSDYVTLLDRREAIGRALKKAQPGDIVVITGKGCEPVIMSKGGRRIPHDDREVVRKQLRELQRS